MQRFVRCLQELFCGLILNFVCICTHSVSLCSTYSTVCLFVSVSFECFEWLCSSRSPDVARYALSSRSCTCFWICFNFTGCSWCSGIQTKRHTVPATSTAEGRRNEQRCKAGAMGNNENEQGWLLCFPRPKSWSLRTSTRKKKLRMNVPVGCTNIYVHSFCCASKVASAYVPREKSKGLCKSMLCY